RGLNTFYSCDLKPGFAKCNDYFDEQRNITLYSNTSFRAIGAIVYCACDQKCAFFNDCCEDIGQDRIEFSKFDIEVVKPKCEYVKLEDYLFRQTYAKLYVIKKCPTIWNNEVVKRRCETEFSMEQIYPYEIIDESLHLNSVMIFSNKTKVYYRNIFCALCNEDVDQLTSFEISIKCHTFGKVPKIFNRMNVTVEMLKKEVHFENFTKSWHLRFKDHVYSCAFHREELMKFLKQQPIENRRPCIPSIDECVADWKNENTRRKCHSYTNYVISSKPPWNLYKNFHCAQCNGENGEIECERIESNVGISPFISTSLRIKSLPLLLDIKIKAGNMINNKECLFSKAQVFNPFSRKCEDFSCFQNFEKDEEKGSCKSKEHFENSGLKANCKAITIEHSLVTLINASMIYVNKTAKYYSENEFEIDEKAKKVSLCISDHFHSFPEMHHYIQAILSILFICLSIFCLIIHIAAHCILPNLQTEPVKPDANNTFCVINGVMMHYFYLCGFFWMNVMSIDVFAVFRQNTKRANSSSINVKYWVYAWITPSIIVSVALLNEFLLPNNDYQALYGSKVCWISQRRALLVFFALPLMLILIVNILLFCLTVKHLLTFQKSTRMVLDKNEHKIKFELYLKLSLLMGFTWIFGFFACFNGISFLWYPFIVFNGLQGVFMFLSFTCKRKNYHLLKGIVSTSPKNSSRLMESSV
ncbi:uncharacterized protein B4U79_14573, partial [Dinothrombium tinctorium]